MATTPSDVLLRHSGGSEGERREEDNPKTNRRKGRGRTDRTKKPSPLSLEIRYSVYLLLFALLSLGLCCSGSAAETGEGE